jgi:hypothetical protein
MQSRDPAATPPPEPADLRWQALVAQHDLLSAAAAVAWSALVEAYRPSADGMIRRQPELLQRYQAACAMRAAAEADLLSLLQPMQAGKADGSMGPV